MFKRQGTTPVFGTDGCIDDVVDDSPSTTVPAHESTFGKIITYAKDKKAYILAGLAILTALAVARKVYNNGTVIEPKVSEYKTFGSEPDEQEINS